MFLHVVDAKHIEAHRVEVRFNDGGGGGIELSQSLEGPIFEPLREVEYFRHCAIEGHTWFWPHGADFAPEYLREWVEHRPLPDLSLKLETSSGAFHESN